MAKVTYGRQPTGNRTRDVQNPVFKEAEERIFRWLEPEYQTIIDARPQKTFYDFRINGLWTLDVKCDQWAVTSGRVAWEVATEAGNGVMRPSWGQNVELDYVAYVLPNAGEEWPFYMVHTPAVRVMLGLIEEGHITPAEGAIVPFTKMGDRTGIGLAISLDLLREHGCIVEEGTC